jgi:hypothetical protein
MTQLLIYKQAVPVTAARHGKWSVAIGANYAFSGEVNSVPLMAVEFPSAASEYAIVFAGAGSEILPAVILGVRGNENLFLSKDANWGAKYIPAFVRRYPFVFSRSGDRFVLCVDEEYPGFNQEGRGQPLFGEDGNPSTYVGRVLSFLQDYQVQFMRTQRFCEKLKELDLLEPMQAQVRVDSDRQLSLGGFMAVSREKLKALSGDSLAELARTDALELLYLHLQSMRNFDGLRDRLETVLHEQVEPPPSMPEHMTAASDGVAQIH